MRTAFLVVAMLGVAMGFISVSAGEKGKSDVEAKKIALAKSVLAQAKIDFVTALKTAQQKVPMGKPLIARSEMKNDKARFGFYFLKEGKLQEVEVDVVSGDVVKFEEKKNFAAIKKFADAQKAVQEAKVTFTQAIEIASQKVKGGRLFEVEMELDGEKGVVEVEFLVGERISKVRVDAKDPSSVKVR